MESKLHDVKGRVDYISNPERQENLYAVFSNVEEDYWKLLAEQNQRDFLKSGMKGTCIEAREVIIMLPPSLINMDHELLLEYMTSVFTDKYNVGCCAALHHNKRKTNLHIHLIFSEREMKQKADQKIASRNMFYNEEGKHVRTKKEILDEDGKVRAGCRIIKKGEVYEQNYFGPKLTEFKTNEFLVNMKQSMTNCMNLFIKDENERLHVFQKGGPYLATKKIGKNNPKEMEMRVDNYLRQEWKVQNYEYAFQNKRREQHGNIVFECDETEFYDGEIKDMIMRLLQNEKSQMDTDPNQVGWRKYHVLKALLESNEIIGKGEELERELKNILSQVDRISSKDKKRLIELGFISRENKHNKLYFHGDDRYMITLGKTPGDSRAAANAASIAINTIVC